MLRGRLDEGEQLAQEALALSGGMADDPASMRARVRPGRRMARGHWRGSAGQGTRCRRGIVPDASDRDIADAGMREPGESRFLPDTIETLIGLGRVKTLPAVASSMEQMANGARRPTAVGMPHVRVHRSWPPQETSRQPSNAPGPLFRH